METGGDGLCHRHPVSLPGQLDLSPKSHLPKSWLLQTARTQHQPTTLPLAQVGPDLIPKCLFPSPELPHRRALGDSEVSHDVGVLRAGLQ